MPLVRTIYRRIYEKYIDVNLKVLRHKGKSRDKKKPVVNLILANPSVNAINQYANVRNSDIGKLTQWYQAVVKQKLVSLLWQKETLLYSYKKTKHTGRIAIYG